MRQLIMPPLLLGCCFLALFALAEFLYYRQNIKAEWTRKIVHIGTGILTLLFPIFLENHWQVLFLCGSFLIILLISIPLKWLQSINGIDRFSFGSILYPIIVYCCYLYYQSAAKGLMAFYLPVMILAICDPVAAFIGQRYPFGEFYLMKCKKTITGSFAFFMTCLLITFIIIYLCDSTRSMLWENRGAIVLIPASATLAEAIGIKGTDNLTIPASVVLTLHLI